VALHDITIQDVLSRNARIYGDQPALIYGDLRLTYGQYFQRVNCLASGLASLGVGKGDRIGVIAFNCLEYFLLYGAVARLGAIMLPINWRLKPKEIQMILEDCSPKIIVVDPEFADMAKEMVDLYKFISYCVLLGKERVNGLIGIHDIEASDRELVEVDITYQDPFVIIPTAAVQGRYKGAVLTHGNIISANIQTMAVMGLQSNSVYLTLLPLFHTGGLAWAMHVIHVGGRNVIIKKFDVQEAVDLIEREQVTIIGTFPPMLSKILEHAEASGKSLSSLRIVSGMDDLEIIMRCQRVTGARFWVGFGQTETTGFFTYRPFDERPGSAGMEGPLTRIRIVDEYDREVPVGQVGEITVRGPLIFQKYWNSEEEIKKDWHHTGDLGYVDEKGYLWYMGRKPEKELIKPGGENVYPIEVEKVILEHPDIIDTCVIGVPYKEWGEAIKAICVRRKGSTVGEKELIEFVGSRIASYKKPKYVTFVEELPKTGDGEVNRKKIIIEHGSVD
jgi:long-chain acyl-CoA synthetase